MLLTIVPDRRPQDALHLLGSERAQASGIEWVLEPDLEGWHDGAELRVEEMPEIPGMHGTFWPDEVLMGARVLTIPGYVQVRGEAGSSLGLAAARNRLLGLVGEPLTIQVIDEAGPLQVSGYLAAPPILQRRVARRRFGFSLVVRCPDPLKYGPLVHHRHTVGETSLELENSGTGDVAFVVSAATRIRSLLVELGQNRVEWIGDATGLVLDLADGRPLAPSGSETGYLVSADAVRVPPGVHALRVVADAPVTVSIRPGWK